MIISIVYKNNEIAYTKIVPVNICGADCTYTKL